MTYTAVLQKEKILHSRSVEVRNICMEQQLEAVTSTVNKFTQNTICTSTNVTE